MKLAIEVWRACDDGSIDEEELPAEAVGECAPRSNESRTRLVSGSDPYPNWRKVL